MRESGVWGDLCGNVGRSVSRISSARSSIPFLPKAGELIVRGNIVRLGFGLGPFYASTRVGGRRRGNGGCLTGLLIVCFLPFYLIFKAYQFAWGKPQTQRGKLLSGLRCIDRLADPGHHRLCCRWRVQYAHAHPAKSGCVGWAGNGTGQPHLIGHTQGGDVEESSACEVERCRVQQLSCARPYPSTCHHCPAAGSPDDRPRCPADDRPGCAGLLSPDQWWPLLRAGRVLRR